MNQMLATCENTQDFAARTIIATPESGCPILLSISLWHCWPAQQSIAHHYTPTEAPLKIEIGPPQLG